MLIDSHCHLDFAPLAGELSATLDEAASVGITDIVVPGVARSNWAQVAGICRSASRVACHPGIGLHPFFLDQHQDQIDLNALTAELARPEGGWVAVGECGLDLAIPDPQFERQRQLLVAQLELADQFHLPVILHCRKALDQLLKILRAVRPAAGGVVHAFSGSVQQAEQLFDLGFRLGIGGALTYPRAQRLRRVAVAMPLDALLLETDAPDMPLCGFQGQPNRPARLRRVAEQLAELRAEPLAEVAAQTSANARRLFNLAR